MISIGCSKLKIIREMDKCECLCSNCHRKHHQEERKIKKNPSEIQLLIRYLKKDKKCAYCEENMPCCLDFHHIDPSTKLFTIGNAIKMRLEKEEIIKEADKCLLLCSNHHKLLHEKGGFFM